MVARPLALPSDASVPVPPLTPDDLPPGYRRSATPPARTRRLKGARDEAACRWVPPRDAPPSAPLAVDVSVATFGQRTAALQALTAPPVLPAELEVRPLFAPRIGEETAALRADVTEDDTRYVLYQVDVQVGHRLATVAAIWRWPAGSPTWVYDRARRLVSRLTEAD